MEMVASALAKQAHRRDGEHKFTFVIYEVALGVNMDARERDDRKVHW